MTVGSATQKHIPVIDNCRFIPCGEVLVHSDGKLSVEDLRVYLGTRDITDVLLYEELQRFRELLKAQHIRENLSIGVITV